MGEITETRFPLGEDQDMSTMLFLYYRYPDRDNIKVMYPTTLTASDDGHKIVDSQGVEHFAPNGFIHLKLKPRDDVQEEGRLDEEKGTENIEG